MCKFYKKLSDGFTLIELLVVIVLLAILSGVLYSVINPETSRNAARGSIKIANINKIVDAVETFINLEGKYPKNEAELISSAYVLNWPDGEPSATDTYEYRYDESSESYTVSTDNTSSSFSGAFRSTDPKYLVYSSQAAELLECPAGQLSDDCVKLTGGEYIPSCISPGHPCTEASECCREAPYCSGGVCKVCVPSGGSCGDASECCSSVPYCVSNKCLSCVPEGFSCNTDSDCCPSASFCYPRTGKCAVLTAELQSEIDVRLIYDAIILACSNTGKPLGQITGNWCSDCACRYGELGSVLCYTTWINARTKIDQAAGPSIDLSGIDRDPWGNPYLLDENELEWAWDPCRKDSIRSNGGYGLRVPYYTSTCF